MCVPLMAEDDIPERLDSHQVVSTFSIVAYDPELKAWGIGVASKFLAVGHVVPWAKSDVGAIATQSFANTTYGPEGLKLLDEGKSPEEVIKILTNADEKQANRQVGIVDRDGNAATFTGEKCLPWCGGKTGKFYACQGNILAGPEVVDNMAKAYEESEAKFAWRIMAALEAADAAGGDIRGRQSAAILIVKDGAGYGGYNDRMIDFRVDDHEQPIIELGRILSLRVPPPQEKVEVRNLNQSQHRSKHESGRQDYPRRFLLGDCLANGCLRTAI